MSPSNLTLPASTYNAYALVKVWDPWFLILTTGLEQLGLNVKYSCLVDK